MGLYSTILLQFRDWIRIIFCLLLKIKIFFITFFGLVFCCKGESYCVYFQTMCAFVIYGVYRCSYWNGLRQHYRKNKNKYNIFNIILSYKFCRDVIGNLMSNLKFTMYDIYGKQFLTLPALEANWPSQSRNLFKLLLHYYNIIQQITSNKCESFENSFTVFFHQTSAYYLVAFWQYIEVRQ